MSEIVVTLENYNNVNERIQFLEFKTKSNSNVETIQNAKDELQILEKAMEKFLCGNKIR